MANRTLGEKLLELRTDRNLTQQQVSDALHIGRVTYTYYEGNKRTPDLSLLLSICKLYGIEIADLINENTIPASNPDTSVKGTMVTKAVATTGLRRGLISGVLEGTIDTGIKTPFTKLEKEVITNFRRLNTENKEEVSHMIKYKLRKQKEN